MPHSLVFNLVPLSSLSSDYLTGRHLHALFLTLVSQINQDLGNALHTRQINKAFTLSPLQTTIHNPGRKGNKLLSQHHQPIPANTPCWWRVSLLDEQLELFRKLSSLWINPNHPWRLGNTDLVVTSILGTNQSAHPWASASTYQALYEQASETERSFHFTLSTPTAFRQTHYDTALPTKELVFQSLLNRWNQYSDIPVCQIPLDSLFPSFFDIRTEMVADSRSKFIGCVGEIHYRLLGKVSPLQIKHMNLLADFALYCGIGRKTTMGMGMSRRLSSKSDEHE